ncbi:Chromo domain-containing protein [Mycena chlorophos]|uniref:Chromo domain-containing protein n=1 Tax=Mycena chlorophos TaxID=658473 RepID=A0A8H6T306_MYCCL|nr:Chromo domain-containing protein [Mycena chlorophos]
MYPVFHTAEISPWNENDNTLFPGRELTRPGPVVTLDGQEEFYVEEIIDKRERYGNTEYRVRWRGYGRESDDWLDESELVDSAHLEAFQNGLDQSGISDLPDPNIADTSSDPPNDLKDSTPPDLSDIVSHDTATHSAAYPAGRYGLRKRQEELILRILDGSDVLLCTATGSGKSALFTVPILVHLELSQHPELYPSFAGWSKPVGVVITPTKGLARNIALWKAQQLVQLSKDLKSSLLSEQQLLAILSYYRKMHKHLVSMKLFFDKIEANIVTLKDWGYGGDFGVRFEYLQQQAMDATIDISIHRCIVEAKAQMRGLKF